MLAPGAVHGVVAHPHKGERAVDVQVRLRRLQETGWLRRLPSAPVVAVVGVGGGGLRAVDDDVLDVGT